MLIMHLTPTLGPVLLTLCLVVPCVLWCRHAIYISVVHCVLLLLYYWAFVEKTSVKQHLKSKVCSNVLFALSQMDPHR